MRNFEYEKQYEKLLTPETMQLVAKIHEFKGEQKIFVETKSSALVDLLETAKIQSTEASNRIEGIVTAEDRLSKIVQNKTTLRNRSEREIAGYRDVLNTIHESFEYIPVKPGVILQLHRDLYKFTGSSFGGKFKDSDNVIAETATDGSQRVRFEPAHSWETPEYMTQLCSAYTDAVEQRELDPLLVMPMFILDFLCIHPFNDGNGRMSRLLTLLTMYRAGYFVGKYISIEKLIADSKETYYEVLYESSISWHNGENDYEPFTRYMLGVIVAAYRDFSDRSQLLLNNDLSKYDRVKDVVKKHLGKITMAEIVQLCPDISKITIQRAVKDMLDNDEVTKIGGGRYTAYVWNEGE